LKKKNKRRQRAKEPKIYRAANINYDIYDTLFFWLSCKTTNSEQQIQIQWETTNNNLLSRAKKYKHTHTHTYTLKKLYNFGKQEK